MKPQKKPRETATGRASAVVELKVGEMYGSELNCKLEELVDGGVSRIRLHDVSGQRSIAAGLRGDVRLDIHGVPGPDLGARMDGPAITVYGDVPEGVGNTMNGGEIVIYGNAGDMLGMAMRGGAIYLRGDAGGRAAIHMQDYDGKSPVIVVGGTARDSFCMNMTGGTAILLGLTLKPGEMHGAQFIGAGMRGGALFIRGSVEDHRLGGELAVRAITDADYELLHKYLSRYAELFNADTRAILNGGFTKYAPVTLRPNGKLYAY